MEESYEIKTNKAGDFVNLDDSTKQNEIAKSFYAEKMQNYN